MLENIPALAAEYDMLPRGETILCAVSGGADSMCLLHLLWSGQEEGGYHVAAAHFDHCLRGEESRRDAAFVADWCRERQIPCHLGEGDVAREAEESGEGVEAAARRLRYAFLEDTAQKIGAGRIATAHNADDNGETLLLHLVRGSGLQGLTGIPPRRGNLVRPLLTTLRADIADYLERHGVPHVEDSTNTDTRYSRNFLRHQVMPLLRELNPNLTAALSSAARTLRTDNDYLTAQAARAAAAARWAEDDLVIRAEILAGLPAALAPRVIQSLVDQLGNGTILSRLHREQILQLARSQDPAAQLPLPGGLMAQRVYEDVLFTTDQDPLPPLERRTLSLPGTVTLEEIGVTAKAEACTTPETWEEGVIYLSREKTGDSLILRSRQTGDRIALPGREEKTIKKLFIDGKIPRRIRERVPVAEADGQVAAVGGFGPDQRFQARPGEHAWRLELD